MIQPQVFSQEEEIILYLNFNSIKQSDGSYESETGIKNKEIDAARRAARATGKKLVIFPETPKEGRMITTKDDFMKFFSTLPDGSVKSIIASGHDGNGNFGGMLASLSKAEFNQILQMEHIKENSLISHSPPLFDKIRPLISLSPAGTSGLEDRDATQSSGTDSN